MNIEDMFLVYLCYISQFTDEYVESSAGDSFLICPV